MAPRRRTSQNNADNANDGRVYGPRSALTSFLREQGITGPGANLTYVNRRQGTLQRTPLTPADDANGDDSAMADVSLRVDDEDGTAESGNAVAGPSGSNSSARTPASSHAHAEAGPSSSTTSPASKRKGKPLTAAQAKKAKAAAAEKEGEGDFTLAGKNMPAPKKARYDNRMPGAIKVCAECGKKFTVSKYTASNPKGPGLLCAPCTSESIEDRATFPSVPKGKAAPKKKKAEKAVKEEQYTAVRTLQQTCLQIIASALSKSSAIEEGAFSYLGPKNLDKLAKIVSKNRALDGENMRLFLEVGHREVRLFDCTNITDTSLALISTFCPHLISLTLLFCGRLDDDVLEAWLPALSPRETADDGEGAVATAAPGRKGLRELKHLTLYAPYLVTGKKWVEFFERRGKDKETEEFETFRVRMSARFTDASLAALVRCNPHVQNLQLSEIGKFTGDSLKLLYPLSANNALTTLDLSRLGTPQGTVLEDEEVIALLKEVGKGLGELVLDGNIQLTCNILTEGIAPHCRSLTTLSLSNLPLLTAPNLASLFHSKTNWSPSGLSLLNLHRAHEALTPSSLTALLNHSGKSLKHLNLHSCDEILPESLEELAEKASGLEVLDVSFVRAVDNFVVKTLLDKCEGLRVLFVHGNNRVTSDVPRRAGVQLRGLENAVHSEIPAGMRWDY
ncbi:hypothetical protein JCM11641_006484 [Rhodosporidiobolus odoratus]